MQVIMLMVIGAVAGRVVIKVAGDGEGKRSR